MKRGEFWTGITTLLTGAGLLESHTGGAAGLGPVVAGTGMLVDRAMRSTPGRIMRAKTGAAAGDALKSAAQNRGPSSVITGAAAIGAERKTVGVRVTKRRQTIRDSSRRCRRAVTKRPDSECPAIKSSPEKSMPSSATTGGGIFHFDVIYCDSPGTVETTSG